MMMMMRRMTRRMMMVLQASLTASEPFSCVAVLQPASPTASASAPVMTRKSKNRIKFHH